VSRISEDGYPQVRLSFATAAIAAVAAAGIAVARRVPTDSQSVPQG
jgi:Ser/Thr protein kinase RdoA (MazF antagonist)